MHTILLTAVVLGAVTTAQALSAALGALVPLATDLIVKSHEPRKVKAAVAFVLSALAGVLPTVTVDGDTRWQAWAWRVGLAWAVALASHAAGVSDWLQARTANFGIGHADPANRAVKQSELREATAALVALVRAFGPAVTVNSPASDAPASAATVKPDAPTPNPAG